MRNDSLLRFDRFTLDLGRGCLRDGEREIKLRPKSFEVLRFLAENADRLVGKDEIVEAVWPSVAVTDDSLVQCVTELRQALDDHDRTVIRTVPRRGYRFVPAVSIIPDGAPIASMAEPAEGSRSPRGEGGAPAQGRRVRPTRLAATLAILLLLTIGATGIWWQGRQGPIAARDPVAVDRPAIAVLPFDDLGGDERQRRLAEAFAEDLIAELARSRDLLVIAGNSSFTYRGRAVDVRQIGRELEVGYVLAGSLRTGPDRLGVTARLVEAATGALLWSERYDRTAAEFLVVRDEILTRLVGTLTGYDGPMWTAWQEAAQRKPAQDLGAWDYLLMARIPYRRHDKEGNAEARRLLEKAIELDPGFARAWEFLANTHGQDWINGWAGDRTRSLALMRETAERAAALDPLDSRAQLMLGSAYFAHDEVELGSAAWQRALALGPNDALVNRAIGGQLPIALGVERAAEGVELVERALSRLDPLHPAFQYLSLAIPLYFAGRYADAVAAVEKVPDPWLEVRIMLALSSGQAGLADKARQNAEQILRLEPGFTAEAWVDNDFYQPGGNSAALFFDGARKAGLPLCARPEDAAKFAPRNRLAECDVERGGIALSKK